MMVQIIGDSLVGGSGDDIFRFSSTTGLTSGDTVTGGAGTDTINLIILLPQQLIWTLIM